MFKYLCIKIPCTYTISREIKLVLLSVSFLPQAWQIVWICSHLATPPGDQVNTHALCSVRCEISWCSGPWFYIQGLTCETAQHLSQCDRQYIQIIPKEDFKFLAERFLYRGTNNIFLLNHWKCTLKLELTTYMLTAYHIW